MAKVIEVLKKNEDPLIDLVSNENDQGPPRNVPLGDDLGQTTKNDAQVQEVAIEQGNNTQNQEQPTNVPLDIAQQQEEQEQEQYDDEDEEEDDGESRAMVSKRPRKIPAPPPQTNNKNN